MQGNEKESKARQGQAGQGKARQGKRQHSKAKQSKDTYDSRQYLPNKSPATRYQSGASTIEGLDTTPKVTSELAVNSTNCATVVHLTLAAMTVITVDLLASLDIVNTYVPGEIKRETQN